MGVGEEAHGGEWRVGVDRTGDCRGGTDLSGCVYRLPFGAFLETRALHSWRSFFLFEWHGMESLGGLGVYRTCVRAWTFFERAPLGRDRLVLFDER